MKSKVNHFLKELIWKLRQIKLAFYKVSGSFLRKIGLGWFLNLKMPGWIKALIALAPAMILLGIFTFYPIINSFILSFYEGYNMFTQEVDGYTFTGNYLEVLGEKGFILAILNTAIIVGISVPISILVGLLIAVALNAIKALKGFFQTIFFLPYVTNTIAIGLVFAVIFKGNKFDLHNLGLANKLISLIGLKPIIFLGAGATYWAAMFTILFYSVWASLAFKIVVFLSGIQGIDKQYYQAAEIDGAKKAKIFRRITVPLISPMIFYILITSVIGAFKTYASVIAIVGDTGTITAGINGEINLKTIVFYIYDYLKLSGVPGRISLAAAASIILFAIILLLTLIQFWVSKKRVHY